MRRLWAPWRMKYIKSADKKGVGCFICRALREKKDRENLLLVRGKRALVILNRYPYNTGHLLIAPVRHTGKLERLTNDEVLEMHALLTRMVAALGKAMKPHGFNIGINLGRAAGAGLPGHAHIHVVPRWNGDTNFMPVVGGTKVMPQSLDEVYQQLARVLRRK